MGAVQAITYRAALGEYHWPLEKRSEESWVAKIANRITSDQPVEIHKWLASAPGMKKWSGERKAKKLRDEGLTVVNDKFENTITADVDDVEMDKFGFINLKIQELGSLAALLPEELIIKLLEANGTAYDGIAYFGNHTGNGGTTSVINNLLTKTGATTPDDPSNAYMAAAIMASITAIRSAKSEENVPINSGANSFGVLVPTKYLGAAQSAISDAFLAAGQSNPLKASKFSIEVWDDSRLNTTAAAAGRRFYTFRLDAPIKALLWQERDLKNRGFKMLGPDSDGAFWKDEYAWGGKRVGQAALGRFELAARMEVQA